MTWRDQLTPPCFRISRLISRRRESFMANTWTVVRPVAVVPSMRGPRRRTLASPPPDEVARRRIHLLLNVGIQMPPRFELEYRYEIRCVDQGLILQAFLVSKSALVGPLRERIDSFLNWWGNLQLDHSTRTQG